MAHEDITAHYLKSYLASPHDLVKALKPAFDFAIRRADVVHSIPHNGGPREPTYLRTVAELAIFFKSLLMEEDTEDAKHSDNLAVQDESRAVGVAIEQGKLAAPFFLGNLAVYWLASKEDRIQRRIMRKDLRRTIQFRIETESQDARKDARPVIRQRENEEKSASRRGGKSLLGQLFRRKQPK